jgi:type II pantothenate kinase
MGIDSLAAHEVIREVLLGAPYTGQFPSLPVTQQQENVSTIYLHVATYTK